VWVCYDRARLRDIEWFGCFEVSIVSIPIEIFMSKRPLKEPVLVKIMFRNCIKYRENFLKFENFILVFMTTNVVLKFPRYVYDVC
jgi:hypothetical protein